MERIPGQMDKDNSAEWRHGIAIRRVREQKNLTQKQLADRVNAAPGIANPISEENIRDIELGKKDVVPKEVLQKIHEALEVSGIDVFVKMNLEQDAAND